MLARPRNRAIAGEPAAVPVQAQPEVTHDRTGDHRLVGHGRHGQLEPDRRHASAAIRRFRAEAQREIGIAHAETTRARARAAQLSRELASWTAGCKQGREDVITLMPLILAQANPAAAGPDADAEDRA